MKKKINNLSKLKFEKQTITNLNSENIVGGFMNELSRVFNCFNSANCHTQADGCNLGGIVGSLTKTVVN